jgi:hypothetical protein
MSIRIAVADRDDRARDMVHLVDMNIPRHWPTLVKIRPSIGGGPCGQVATMCHGRAQ